MDSFTLVEILIVVGIIAILASFSFSVGLNFYKSQQLETQAQEILQTLRRAQSKAMAIELDSSFGVYFDNANKKYILFKGDSYSPGDPYNEEFDLPAIITLSGLSEVVFLKLEGIPKGSPAYCGGICVSCSQFTSRTSCLAQDGCTWNRVLRRCVGTCTSCENYQNQTDCQGQSGCIWYPSSQGGDIILSSNGQQRTININEIGRINLQ